MKNTKKRQMKLKDKNCIHQRDRYNVNEDGNTISQSMLPFNPRTADACVYNNDTMSVNHRQGASVCTKKKRRKKRAAYTKIICNDAAYIVK